MQSFMKAMKTHLDGQLFTQFILPKELPWSSKVNDIQVFGSAINYVSCGYPPFGAMEVRVVFSGSILVVGISDDYLPNKDLKVARKTLLTMPKAELQKLVETHGFLTEVMHGELVVIPSGFFCIVISTSASEGLRWTISSDQPDTLRVHNSLKQLLSVFPELRSSNTGYAAFEEWLSHKTM